MPDLAERVALVSSRADEFRDHTLNQWTEAVDTTQPAAVARAAETIIAGWRSLRALHDGVQGSALASGLEHAATGVADALGFDQQEKESEPEHQPDQHVDGRALYVADAKYIQARNRIGCTVLLQYFKGQAVTGRTNQLDQGRDPVPWIQRQLTTALGVFDTIAQLTALFQSPRELTSDETRFAQALLKQHQWRELNFIALAMNDRGLGAPYGALRNTKAMREHNKEVIDRAAVTRDETLGAGVSKERTNLMRKAAAEIKDELDDIAYASDRKIDRWIAEFSSDTEREMFVALLSREGLLAAMHHRGNSENVERYVKSTDRQRDWRYDESNNWSMTLGETNAYLGDEMLRQAPGVACAAAAGIFNNLSDIPLAGRLFAKDAEAFRELGKWADEATGADDSWRAERNALAEGSGNLLGGALWGKAASELGALAGISQTRKATQVVGWAMDVQQVYQGIQTFKAVYDDGKRVWDSAMDILLELPHVVTDFASDSPLNAIDRIDKLIDTLAGRASDTFAEHATGEDVEKQETRRAERADTQAHQSAVQKRDALQARGVTGPALDDARERVHQTAAVRRGEAASPTAVPDTRSFFESSKEKAKRALMKTLFDAFKGVLMILKDALVTAIKKTQGNVDRDAADIARDGIRRAGKGASKLVLATVEKHGSKMLWETFVAIRKHPELYAFKDPITKALQEVIHQGIVALGLDDRLEDVFTEVAAYFAPIGGLDIKTSRAGTKS